jgi:hypothetical protein
MEILENAPVYVEKKYKSYVSTLYLNSVLSFVTLSENPPQDPPEKILCTNVSL